METFKIEIQEFLARTVEVQAENLSEAITFEDTKKYGKSIYYKIQTFIPIVKKLSDEKKEKSLK